MRRALGRWRAAAPWAAALWIAGAFMLAGCGDRQRTNPLDPFGGAADNPWSASVVAGDGRVEVRWRLLSFEDVSGFRIERVDRVTSETVAFLVDADVTRLVDSTAVNDRGYEYRLVPFLAGTRDLAAVDSLFATPGPEVCWVADTGGFRLQQLTPDARAASLVLDGFRAPNSVSVPSNGGDVWVADTFNGRVVRLDRAGVVQAQNALLSRPKAVSAGRDGSVWVADEGTALSPEDAPSGSLHRIAASGELLVSRDGFLRPSDVAVWEQDHSVWMCDRWSGTLWRFSAAGSVLLQLERYSEPLQLAIDERDGTVWLTDDTLSIVAHIGTDGTELARWGTERPFGVVVDPIGSIWLTNFDGNTVQRFTADGRRVRTIAGLTGPLGIDVNPRDGSVWVVDSGADAVVKYSSTGVELARRRGFLSPFDLAIDTGR